MSKSKNLVHLLSNLKPKLNPGEYVYVHVVESNEILSKGAIMEFKEKEGITLIISKAKALSLKLDFEYVAAWITLQVHSALEAVGLTAAISASLAEDNISCNIVAGYFHDHIFVNILDADKAIKNLINLSKRTINK